MHVVELVLFDDELNQEINCCLLIHACYTYVAKLVSFMFIAFNRTYLLFDD